MSTALVAAPTTRRGAAERPRLDRLTLVELRKMADTRAGLWLLISTAAITALVAVVAALAFPDDERNLLNFLAVCTVPASILLPVMGILLVTSEWSQRTAVTTFTLVPSRSRVLVAKLLAGLALSLIALALCLVVALVTTALAGADGEATWSLSAGLIGQAALSVAVPMLTGIGFGAVLLVSAPAIVLFFVLPTAWAALGSIPALEGAARWLDQARTMGPLLEQNLSALEWAHLASSLALWTLLPIALGCWRVSRADVR